MKHAEASPLRFKVYARMRQWQRDGWLADGDRSHILWDLLGRPVQESPFGMRNFFVAIDELSDEEAAICKMLAGEHGWAIYQMLKIRREGG